MLLGQDVVTNLGEFIQTQHFCHRGDTIWHPNSSYITFKLYGISACGCNNNVVMQIQARWSGSG